MKEAAKNTEAASRVKKHKSVNKDTNRSKLRELTRDLRERVKELNCLYGISRLVEQEGVSLDEIMQQVAELIPASWQYPEDTCARIKLTHGEFKTVDFLETVWKQSELITVNGNQFGTLEVCYLREKPHCDEGPFLKEERNLIHAIAERLGHIIEHKFAEDELQSLYEQERNLREKLQAEMRARVDFTRNLIHELKTPLTALVATSQLLIDEAEGTELGKLAQLVWEGANNVNNRIDELHDVIRGEIGKLKLELKPLNLKRLILSLVEETRALCLQRDVSINVELRERLLEVYADPVRVRQIMLNLLNNALKYASEGKKIVVAAKKRPGFGVVEVRDYGPGIVAKEQRNLFQPGYQSAYPEERTRGLGIGLALCRILVELHGGRIWVESKVGKGSSFFFTLPLLKSDGKKILGKVR